MGTQWRQSSANKKTELGHVDQSEGRVHQWKLWVDIRQHPQLPTLDQHQHCLESGKTFTTASVTWSLGINKTGRSPQAQMNGHDPGQWMSLHQFISNTEGN